MVGMFHSLEWARDKVDSSYSLGFSQILRLTGNTQVTNTADELITSLYTTVKLYDTQPTQAVNKSTKQNELISMNTKRSALKKMTDKMPL